MLTPSTLCRHRPVLNTVRGTAASISSDNGIHILCAAIPGHALDQGPGTVTGPLIVPGTIMQMPSMTVPETAATTAIGTPARDPATGTRPHITVTIRSSPRECIPPLYSRTSLRPREARVISVHCYQFPVSSMRYMPPLERMSRSRRCSKSPSHRSPDPVEQLEYGQKVDQVRAIFLDHIINPPTPWKVTSMEARSFSPISYWSLPWTPHIPSFSFTDNEKSTNRLVPVETEYKE